MNHSSKTMQVLKVWLVCMLAFVCFGCNRSSSHQVAHVFSPNGNLEAVLVETGGDATTSFGYDVSLGLKGTGETVKVATLYGAIRNEQAYGVNLLWVGNDVLEVEYLRAKAVLNVLSTAEVNGRQIRTILKSGIEDPKAPAGGMFFNIQKQSH